MFRDEPRREVQDELEFHLEERAQEYMAAGLDEEAARRSALERMGDLQRVQGECTELLLAERRALARRDWFSDLGQDLRFAVRGAARAPLFTLLGVVTLALGIGANSALFGVVKSVLLDALPYAEPDRLVRVTAFFETQPDLEDGALSAGTVWDITQRQRSFTGVAASISRGPDAVLEDELGASSVRLAWVQPEYFATLGVTPVFGRTFEEAEAESDTSQVVMISHGTWLQRYGGSRAIIGRTLRLNGLSRVVVGVLPSTYVHPTGEADFFMPFALESLLQNPVNARGSHFLEMVARLEPGVGLEAARAEVAAIGEALVEEYPRENRGIRLRAEPLRETMLGDTRTPLLVLMGSAALVLLIACANIAATLVSRMIARRKEFAVRISLGAARGRLVRQLLAESLLLAVAGGLAGLLLAVAGLSILRSANLEAMPEYARLTLDAGAVAFTFILTLLTGIGFGLLPALAASREEPHVSLSGEARGAGDARGAGRMRGLLVAVQVAICLSLLAGAGLLTRSMWLMVSAPLGFAAGDVLTFDVPLSGARYSNVESHIRFREQLSDRLAALPGVTTVAVTNFLPTRVSNSNGVVVVGAERAPGEPTPFVLTTGVSENYFASLEIPIVAGRTFTARDGLDTPPVVVVSEAMARQFWPAGDAIGARIVVGPDPQSPPLEVVGVVGDVRTSLTRAEAEPMLYMPLRQGWWGTTFLVRTVRDPAQHARAARQALAEFDPALPMANVATLTDAIAEGLDTRRLPMLLMLGFGAVALLLASMGIYALFTNMAVARQREFGVRLALGSSRKDLARLVLRDGSRWMGLGLLAGTLGVVAVSRALRTLLYGIAPFDVASITAAVLTLLMAAAIALVVPVRRATRADPLSIMRQA